MFVRLGSQHWSRETRQRQVRRQPAARVSPDQLRAAASARIQRIQASLGALRPEDKEERQALLTALEKAKRHAEVPSMEQQIHVWRSIWPERRNASCITMRQLLKPDRRFSKPNTTKKSMCKVSPDGEDLLRKLKTQAADPTLPMPIADPVGEVARLQQVVADLQRQLQQHAAPVVLTQGVSAVPSISPFRIRKREDHVPATEHRPSRRDDCRSDGPESNRSSAHLKFDYGRHQESSTRVGASVHGHQHGSVRIAQEARTISRYGLRCSRIGEASNSGPPHLRRLRRASQSRIGQSPVSSDEEANMGQDVLPGDAIQQTLIDTDSEDGRPLLQLEPPPEDVISALEADLIGYVACDPISAVRGPRHREHPEELHWSHNLHRALPGPSKIGNHCGHQCLCRTVLQHWMRIHGLKCT